MTTNQSNNDVLRVGHMTYLNSEVFYRNLPVGSCDLVAMPPRAMAAAVERGDLVAGPLPIAEIFRLGDQVRSLGNLGISCDGSAKSVFLFSHYPVDQLSGKRIAVTSHTATSIQLMRVLFADLWNVSGHEFVETDDQHDAALWIGDPALERRSQTIYPYIYDLGTAWKTLTGLPFVFAEWVIRTDVPRETANQLDRLIAKATQSSTDDISILKISQQRATEAMPKSDVADYIRNFTYFLGPKERRGQQEFQRRLDLLPIWRPPSPDTKQVETKAVSTS
jgi:chorismate dehydratase